MPLSLPLPTLDPAVLNVVPRFSFPLNSSCQMNEHDWMVPRIDNNFMPFVGVSCLFNRSRGPSRAYRPG